MNKRTEDNIVYQPQNEAFWKGLKVVQSCENIEHILTAKTYVNLFLEKFSKHTKKGLLSDSLTAHHYEVLTQALKEQEKKLNLTYDYSKT